jgi:hypothetical protein
MVERYNRTLATQLSMFVNENHSDWDEHLHTVLMAYRTAVHESTGQTPARLMMGHELRIPVDLMYGQPLECENNYRSKFPKQLTESLELTHQFARNQLRLSSERMKNQYDIDSLKVCFEVGDNVWLYTPQKRKGLSPKFQRYWNGPFTVVKRINDLVYKLQSGARSKPTTVHRNRLWKYIGQHPQTWLKVSGPTEYEVPVDQQPEISEVIERQPVGGSMSHVEQIPEEEILEQSNLRRSKRHRRPPDRLEPV